MLAARPAARHLKLIHEAHDALPAFARVLTSIAVKDILPTPARILNLQQPRAANGLLQEVEAVLRVLEDVRLIWAAASAVVVGGVVLALEQTVVYVAEHHLWDIISKVA